MGILEQVTEMKRRGLSESEIISNLQQQRISPRDINNALSQSQIKNAVSRQDYELESQTAERPPIPLPGEEYIPQDQEYPEDASISESQEYFPPQPSGNYPQNFQESDSYPSTQQYPQEDYYEQEPYEAASTETDTIIEIAEQVSSEKTKDLQKQIDKLNEFSVLVETRLSNAVERIKKIETTIDKLQLAILDKVGSYGQNLESIKKEMSMMQDSFSKVVKAKTAKKK